MKGFNSNILASFFPTNRKAKHRKIVELSVDVKDDETRSKTKKALKKLPGVDRVNMDPDLNKVLVIGTVDRSEALEAMSNAGIAASAWAPPEESNKELADDRNDAAEVEDPPADSPSLSIPELEPISSAASSDEPQGFYHGYRYGPSYGGYNYGNGQYYGSYDVTNNYGNGQYYGSYGVTNNYGNGQYYVWYGTGDEDYGYGRYGTNEGNGQSDGDYNSATTYAGNDHSDYGYVEYARSDRWIQEYHNNPGEQRYSDAADPCVVM